MAMNLSVYLKCHLHIKHVLLLKLLGKQVKHSYVLLQCLLQHQSPVTERRKYIFQNWSQASKC